MNKFCLIVKPGASEYKNDIIDAFTKYNFTVTTEQAMVLNQAQCDVIWHDVAVMAEERKQELGADYYQRYCNYIMSDKSIIYILQAENIDYDLVTRIKRGVRAKYNATGFQDMLHTSDNDALANAEIAALFKD